MATDYAPVEIRQEVQVCRSPLRLIFDGVFHFITRILQRVSSIIRCIFYRFPGVVSHVIEGIASLTDTVTNIVD